MLSSGCLTQFDAALQLSTPTYSLHLTALIELDMAPMWGIGAGDRVRTGDLLLGKQTLYQLSYSRPASEYTVTVW